MNSLSQVAKRVLSSIMSISTDKSTLERCIKLDSRNTLPMFRKLRAEGRDNLHLNRVVTLAALISLLPGHCEDGLIQNFSYSKSQILQDLLAVLLFPTGPHYFVEVGVGDGCFLSNTYMLEKRFGWDGLLLEPNRAFHETIRATRQAALDQRAAYRFTGETLNFLDVRAKRELSTLVGYEEGDLHRSRRHGDTYLVQTVALNDALTENNAPREIAFMSIDTEGSELCVLNGLNLSKWKIMLLCIECNYDNKKELEILKRLNPLGYYKIFPSISQFDIWLAHESLLSINKDVIIT